MTERLVISNNDTQPHPEYYKGFPYFSPQKISISYRFLRGMWGIPARLMSYVVLRQKEKGPTLFNNHKPPNRHLVLATLLGKVQVTICLNHLLRKGRAMLFT